MEQARLPSGCTLYWEDNGAGGRCYYTDEIGGGTPVWDTALVTESTLLAAMVQEATLQYRYRERQKQIANAAEDPGDHAERR